MVNCKKHFVPYTDFYNDTVNERIDVKEDFIAWKKGNG
jgi:hypothetical protein